MVATGTERVKFLYIYIYLILYPTIIKKKNFFSMLFLKRKEKIFSLSLFFTKTQIISKSFILKVNIITNKITKLFYY